jgi:hypothetical protein
MKKYRADLIAASGVGCALAGVQQLGGWPWVLVCSGVLLIGLGVAVARRWGF